jgi:hypothetical protein
LRIAPLFWPVSLFPTPGEIKGIDVEVISFPKSLSCSPAKELDYNYAAATRAAAMLMSGIQINSYSSVKTNS